MCRTGRLAQTLQTCAAAGRKSTWLLDWLGSKRKSRGVTYMVTFMCIEHPVGMPVEGET